MHRGHDVKEEQVLLVTRLERGFHSDLDITC